MRTRLLAGLLCLLVGLVWIVPAARGQGGTISSSYMETFTGMPATPAAYRPPGWDVQYHHRDVGSWDQGMPMAADHGPACEPPPAQHAAVTVEDAVFVCHDHLMTAVNEGGYGLVTLTPPVLLDWSQGEAVLAWDMSTLNPGGARAYAGVVLTPWADVLTLPVVSGAADLTGAPRNALEFAIHSNGGTSQTLRNQMYREGVPSVLPASFAGTIESALAAVGLAPSAVRRDTFELRISRTHVKFWLPQYNYVGVEADFPEPLPFTQAVIQFQHHDYNSLKDCPVEGVPTATCHPTTWHWDNVSARPAVPFQIERAAPRGVGNPGWPAPDTYGPFTWATPAAAGATLHLSAATGSTTLQVAFDGQTWQPVAPVLNPAEDPAHARSYAIPLLPGATRVWVRATAEGGGGGYWGTDWYAVDAHVWTPPLVDLATPVPTAGATTAPTPAPPVSPVPGTATVPPTGTPPPSATPPSTPLPVVTGTATAAPAASLPPPDPSRPCQVPVSRFGVPTWKDAPASTCR